MRDITCTAVRLYMTHGGTPIDEGTMMTNITIHALGLVTLIGLAGCADPRLGPNSKTGWVTEFYTVEKLQQERPKCLAGLSAEQIAENRYAEISVSHFRSYRYVSALVPASIKLHVHDKVEISPPFCKDGTVPQVIQILKPAS
jgi:hypothetical protein